ncbi:MAG: 3-hydroxybutyrate dehydrogenase [Sphingomonadales bacterium]
MKNEKEKVQYTDIEGKSVIITGSTSGIGLAIAEDFARHGARVMVNGLGDPTEIERTRAHLADTTGAEVLYDAADMTRPDQIARMIARAEDTWGGVDILVNNAGIQYVSPVEEFPAEKWDAILAINLSSVFHTIHAALPGMKARNAGRIINISSVHGLVASPFKSAYVAAKHGVMGLTKTVALEVAETNITVNAICPGYVRTPLVEGQIDEQAKAHNMPRDQVIRDVILASQPNKRFTETSEIAAMALFLCSAHGRSINGAALTMDGGWVAR